MRRFRPRDAALALPWLLAACATEPRPAPQPADDCVMLCALERALFGPSEAPPAAPPPPRVRPHSKAAPQHVTRDRPQPKRLARKPQAETSVVPQTPPPSRSQPRAAVVAPPSPPPAPVGQIPPDLPAQPSNLSQSIPGSVLIMPPNWQP